MATVVMGGCGYCSDWCRVAIVMAGGCGYCSGGWVWLL